MKHFTIDNLKKIENEVQLSNSKAIIIAVSKTFSIEQILPLINYGHTHFGENKVQEALIKWENLKLNNKDIKLHFVGKLQTNKVKHLLPIVDYIHSLDNFKLAEKIAVEQQKKKKELKIFIQVNIGNEPQKNGLLVNDLQEFYDKCTKELKLNIEGLMCIPPQTQDVGKYFKQMNNLNKTINLKELSMGMSEDYLDAVNYGATYIRIGSKIFGNRV